MTKSPLITNCEKPSMMWPAAYTPSLPCDRIRRVVAMPSDSRRMVAMRSTVGKAENSSGRWIHSADHQDQHREGDRQRQAEIDAGTAGSAGRGSARIATIAAGEADVAERALFAGAADLAGVRIVSVMLLLSGRERAAG